MVTGSRCGGRGRALPRAPRELGIGTFVSDEGGYTSVAVALALLVSLTLVFSSAAAIWAAGRSADVQAVADATALAGSNVVASYTTVATVLDACVLTMGMAGMVTLGAGLVVSAVPGMVAAGAQTVNAATRVLEARQRFATSAARGLTALESTLPLAIAARSAAVARANSSGEADYSGCAIPFPRQSQTDFSGLDAEVGTQGATEAAERLQEASERARQAKEAAVDAFEEGWLADCGQEPMSMRERAGALAGLQGAQNPDFATSEGWGFEVAIARARAYYERRAVIEAPSGDGVEERVDSAARALFYAYASAQLAQARCVRLDDGRMDLSLPELPRNTAQMRETTMYTDATWPCTQQGDGLVLHAFADCPGATGPSAGLASLAALDAGQVRECGVCHMDSVALGKVASASTSIGNGFEHYWQRVVEASRDYDVACDELADAERDMQGAAQDGAGAFDEALEALAVPRPRLCPPGAWGCVAVVARSSDISIPPSLTSSFLSPVGLPASAAVSAATLAPDESTRGNGVLTRFFEAISGESLGEAGVLGSVVGLWSSLLQGYGAASGGMGQAAGSVLDGIGGVAGESVAGWLRDAIGGIVRSAGFEPVDLRLRKPVLTNSQNVLDQAGLGGVAEVRELVESLPRGASASQMAQALGQYVSNELGGGSFTVAELPVPGTDLTIPLTLDVGELLGEAA